MFLLRAGIDHAKYLHKPLYVNFYDYRQCFDKLWFEESIISLHRLGLSYGLLSLINCSNQRAVISVKTPIGYSSSFIKENIAKQGTVLAPTMCSSSVGEVCDEDTQGGVAVGPVVIGPMAFVDDITSMNSNVKDAVTSNEQICFFSDKKKQPLNEKKCYLLPINLNSKDAIPIQYVNGQRVAVKSSVECLGDIFNTKGNYDDLVSERIRKGTICLVNAVSTCPNQSMGKFAITSMLTLYKAVFLRTVLNNSEAWCYMSEKNLEKLGRIQMKYLKRMLHCPRGTSNTFLLLELGLLPIEEEIAIRQLMFLHHVLNLSDDDKVKMVFNQQDKFPFEKNWRNYVMTLILKYKVKTSDLQSISKMSKGAWKSIVHDAVTKYSLQNLNLKGFAQSKTAYLCPYENLERQVYIDALHPNQVRMWLQLRGGIYDIKGNRPFQYGDSVCRGCGAAVEDFEHVANYCVEIPRSNDSFNLSDSNELSSVKEVLARFSSFKDLVEDKQE